MTPSPPASGDDPAEPAAEPTPPSAPESRISCDRCHRRYVVGDLAPGTPVVCPECGAILYTAGDPLPALAAADATLAQAVREHRPDTHIRLSRLENTVPPGRLAERLFADGLLDAEVWTQWLKAGDRAPRLLIPEYDLVRRLGRGGMGTVWHGRHIASGRPVAVKILSPHYAANTDDRERFLKEARVAVALDHPNIVKGYGPGAVGPMPYYVMEYVHGQSAGRLLDKHGPFGERRTRNLAIQIARALAYADAQGVVHRDVKPDNLLVGRDGVVKLVDYGIASTLADGAHADDGADSAPGGAHRLFGTPAYVAPEQARGRPVDIRADLYALGGTLFHLLTGHPPFDRATAREMLQDHFRTPARDPRQLNPEVSEAFALVLLKLLAKDPDERYQTPEDLLTALAG